MEIIENNKLIAEFMGSICEMVDHTEGNEDYCKSKGIDKWLIPTWSKPEGFKDEWGWSKYRMGYWEYHSSWDWIMPVVEKIESIGYIFELKLKWAKISDAKTKETIVLRWEQDKTRLDAAFYAVIEFILWYNENKH